MKLKKPELEWDHRKNLSNFEKHGLKFEDAAIVFENETITLPDKRNNYGEERFITSGFLNNRLVILAHTIRNNNIRIISMRKANEREKKTYSERFKKN